MSRLATRVVRTAVGTLLLSLGVVGAGTAAVVQLQAVRALDATLLATALAEAHPREGEQFRNDHAHSEIVVRPWSPGDPRVDAALAAAALDDEVPRTLTRDGVRLLLLATEPHDAHAGPGEAHPHLLLVAEAPAVRLADAALPFAAGYGAVAAAVGLLAALLVRAGLRRALAPLELAVRDLEGVTGLGTRARLRRGGPEEIDRLLAAANDLLERLEMAFDAQADFTAHAAHELRTPLTVLRGELDLALRRERDPEALRDTLRRLDAEVARLAELVDGLTALTRVEAGHADRDREPARLSELVHAAVAREGPGLQAGGIALEVRLSADPELSLHAGLVTTALANLLRNVARHAGAARVRIGVDADAEAAWVCVEDDGRGLPREARAGALARFRRGSASRDGLGLGLPLCEEIARRHGGALTLDDSALGGLRAVFRVSRAAP